MSSKRLGDVVPVSRPSTKLANSVRLSPARRPSVHAQKRLHSVTDPIHHFSQFGSRRGGMLDARTLSMSRSNLEFRDTFGPRGPRPHLTCYYKITSEPRHSETTQQVYDSISSRAKVHLGESQ